MSIGNGDRVMFEHVHMGFPSQQVDLMSTRLVTSRFVFYCEVWNILIKSRTHNDRTQGKKHPLVVAWRRALEQEFNNDPTTAGAMRINVIAVGEKIIGSAGDELGAAPGALSTPKKKQTEKQSDRAKARNVRECSWWCARLIIHCCRVSLMTELRFECSGLPCPLSPSTANFPFKPVQKCRWL